MRSFMAAASEGDSDENARGLAIQSAATHWTLTNSTHAGDPDTTYIFRQAGGCVQRELLVSRAERDAASSRPPTSRSTARRSTCSSPAAGS